MEESERQDFPPRIVQVHRHHLGRARRRALQRERHPLPAAQVQDSLARDVPEPEALQVAERFPVDVLDVVTSEPLATPGVVGKKLSYLADHVDQAPTLKLVDFVAYTTRPLAHARRIQVPAGEAGVVRICSPQIGLTSRSNLGGAVYDYEVLRALAAIGVDVDIPHLFALDVEVPPRWHVHPLPLRRQYRLGAIATNVAFAKGLGAAARRARPDLIRVAYPWYSGPASFWVARRLGIPTAVVFHHLEETESFAERLVHRLVAERATGVHTGSWFSARQLAERYGISEEKVAVIPYGVSSSYRPDEAARRRVREERGFAGRIVLLYVGGLIARKNLSFLVDVFERLGDPQTLLLLCGEGYPKDDYAARLRARIAGSPARERIRLLGRVPESVKRDLYHASDVLVHPARIEGFGLSVAEAMASGRSVLAARAGALPEIVEEEVTGLLASPDSLEEFTEKLGRLVSDASLRERLGARAAADIARRFTWERTAIESLRFYESLT